VGLDGDLIANEHVFSFARRLTTWHCSHSLPNAVLLRRRCRWEPGADAAAVDQYILHACRAHSSKPAAAACFGRMI